MAKFNYNTKCAQPHKCSKLMKDFLTAASNIVDEIKFGNDVLEVKRSISVRKGRHGFCAYLGAYNVRIEYDFSKMSEIGSREFRRNIVMRDESMKGFSDVTLSLLHELGHFATEKDVPDGYNRFQAQAQYKKWCGEDYRLLNLMYFSLPDEWLATQWAIDWLSDEENRKRAKQFERDFFKAWRGE